MRAPSVIIIASPYEGELLGRALTDIGLRVLRADGGDGALALLATELPIAAVIGTTLLSADPAEIVSETLARHQRIALYLLADPSDPVAEQMRTLATAVFRRPMDLDALVHAIEKLAVEEERADFEAGEEIIEVTAEPAHVPAGPTSDEPAPLVRAHRTEILSEGNGFVAALVSKGEGVPRKEEGDETTRPTPLLRADDSLGVADLGLDDVVPPPASRSSRAFDNRSTIAREIDRELSQAERRLFPDQSATPLPFRNLDDYDDALGDIDLDSLAIDTVPGLSQGSSAGVDEARVRAKARAIPPPSRPVQEEGALGEVDIAELIARLHSAAFSGALRVERPEGERTIFFEQGEPIGARSTQRHDHLAELLFREGKLSREQVARLHAEELAGAGPDDDNTGSGRRVALRLVDLGLLKESEIFSVVRRHVEELFFSLFALEAGRYRLGPSMPSSDDRVRLPSGGWALTLEGVRRKYGLERLSARLGGRSAVLHPTPHTARVLAGSAVTDDERRVVALIDGARTLGEVRTVLGSRISESAIFAVAWALRVAGALETGGAGAVDLRYASTVVTSDTSGERRVVPRAVAEEQLVVERAVERERIASKRAQILDADYFAILGVARDANEHELRSAHRRLRADFEASRFADEVAAEHGAALAEIREVLDEALRVLIAPAVRTRYAAHLDAPSEDAR